MTAIYRRFTNWLMCLISLILLSYNSSTSNWTKWSMFWILWIRFDLSTILYNEYLEYRVTVSFVKWSIPSIRVTLHPCVPTWKISYTSHIIFIVITVISSLSGTTSAGVISLSPGGIYSSSWFCSSSFELSIWNNTIEFEERVQLWNSRNQSVFERNALFYL